MLGVILCGGQSSRMGRDKGLIAAQTTNWAGLALEKMSSLNIPVVLSVNNRQKTSYQAIFSSEILIPDNPGLPLKGPLAGILSIHLQYPTEDLFVLACDLPYMEPALLNDLYITQNGRSQVYLYENDSEPEPLCGIYTADGLNTILLLLQSGGLAKHSMKYALEQLLVDLRPIPENKKDAFTNVNSPHAS
jgi:molybdopterin-guanine dinucleotide biosynthesis protein A